MFSNNALLLPAATALESSAPWIATLFLLMAPLSLIRSLQRRRLLDRQSGLDSIREMSWRQFEMLCGETFRRKGYAVEETGLGGADGGVDLILWKGEERVLVQCKRWRTFKVGVREIRELFGILAADPAARAVFVSSGSYTAEARRFAKGKPLDLIDGIALLALIREVQKKPIPPKDRPLSDINERPRVLDRPSCPRCGSPMTLRTAKHGTRAGCKFWVCPSYPKCRGLVQST
jgi:restriction system protein